MSVDPEAVTAYDLDRDGLEENILFWVMVAGKTADVVAPRLGRLLAAARRDARSRSRSPLTILRAFRARGGDLRGLLKAHGIGCHGMKSRAVEDLLEYRFDLRTCTAAELALCHGISRKTANCFLLHTRRDADVVGLDTHMLQELAAVKRARRRADWPAVPKATPASEKRYEFWSGVVRGLAAEKGVTLAAFDLEVFTRRHRKVGRGA
jgi:endonuclease III